MNAEQEIRAKLGDFAADQDLMRDVYMTDSQRAAYQRILSRALEQREGWRPIESAPKDGRMLVLFWNGAWCPGFYLDNSHTQFPWAGWRVPSGQLTPPGQPTHYMEPAAPKPEDAS